MHYYVTLEIAVLFSVLAAALGSFRRRFCPIMGLEVVFYVIIYVMVYDMLAILTRD